MRNRLPKTEKEITDQRAMFQTKLQVPQPKAASNLSNFPKSMKTVTLITVQTSSRGKTKTEFMDPMILGKIKIRGGSTILKIWENSCSCNNWRLPGEPRSLDNLLFK